MEDLNLSNNNIDLACEDVDVFLRSVGVERREALRIKLTLEEVLLEYKERFGEQASFKVRCVKRLMTLKVELPESVVCFLESDDYESAIRLAISFGGDTDTMAAMSGSIAEAFYNRVPDELISYSKMKLTKEAVFLVEKFYKTVKAET